jgi:hypothetical protein
VNKPASERQIRQLNDSVKRLTRVAERLADTLRGLNAEQPSEDQTSEQVIGTLRCELDHQPIVTYDDSDVIITLMTVHGVRETIRVPRRKS